MTKFQTRERVRVTTETHTLNITDCPDLIQRDYTERRPVRFFPKTITVTIENGKTDRVVITGPRRLASGGEGGTTSQAFSYFRNERWESLGGMVAPTWVATAVGIAERWAAQ